MKTKDIIVGQTYKNTGHKDSIYMGIIDQRGRKSMLVLLGFKDGQNRYGGTICVSPKHNQSFWNNFVAISHPI